MKNVWLVFRRDVLRLLRVPASWVICAGICVIPALYAWFNIVGFWDPYGKTGDIPIAVVNEDKGANNSLTGPIDLGDQIVDALKENDQLGWRFVSKAEALDEVESGASYAAIVIPADFSSNMLSIVSGDFTQPKLEYYVNEKINAISPKVTDTGASTVDNTVNSQFVSTVSGVIADTMGQALDKAGGSAGQSRDKATAKLDDAVKEVASSRGKISDLRGELSDMSGVVDQTRDSVATVADASTNLQGTLDGTSTLIDSTQKSAGDFIGSMSGTLDQSGSLLSQAAGNANTSIGQTAGTIGKVNGQIDGSLQSAIDRDQQLIDTLTALQSVVPDNLGAIQNAIDQLNGQKDKLTQLQRQNANLGTTVDSIAGTADTINTSVQQTIDSSNGLRANLNANVLPQINTGLTGLSNTAGSMSNMLGSQSGQISQINTLLDQLDTTITKTDDALAATDKSLSGLQKDLDTTSTDLKAIGTSATWKELTEKLNVNAATISDFMSAPTQLETKTLFPVSSYGAAMTPLFTDLSLWIGAFALVVIFKNEVDHEGIDDLTPTQAYMGRWLLMGVLSVAQALIVCVGDLVIGVQTVNAFAFLATGVLTGLAFLSIIYALSVTFLHVGKGLCVVLVMLQIPGASGLYPIEMMPGFFRRLYPYFPFTYGIDMMRETIGGFYDGHYLWAFTKMIVFVAIAFLLGIVIRPYMTNLNRMFAKQIVRTDLMIGEEVQLERRRFRMSQLLAAMSDKDELREMLTDKARDFGRAYPKLKWGALIAGAVSFVVLLVVSALVPVSRKPVMLAAWTIWALLLFAFLVVIEYMRDSLERQSELVDMSAEEIQRMFREGSVARRMRRHAHRRMHHVAGLAAGVAPVVATAGVQAGAQAGVRVGAPTGALRADVLVSTRVGAAAGARADAPAGAAVSDSATEPESGVTTIATPADAANTAGAASTMDAANAANAADAAEMDETDGVTELFRRMDPSRRQATPGVQRDKRGERKEEGR